MTSDPQPSRRSSIAPFYVMEVMKAAGIRQRERGDVLHLEVGQPGTPAPTVVREAAARLLEDDRLGYTDALGTDRLRRAIAGHYSATGRPVDPRRVVITVGASGGFVLALLAAFDEGARVGITEPGYAAYRNIIQALGLELVGIPVDATSRWVVTPELIDRAGPLDGLVIASPSNPTGTAFTHDELDQTVSHCARSGVVLISDEIYHGIAYGGQTSSALDHGDGAIVVQSFSKYFSMTGWRLGWMVVPDSMIDPIERLAQNLFISPPTLSQLAAVEAFSAGDELDGNVRRYAASRDALVAALDRWGLSHAPPDGAFYVWVDVRPLGMDSAELCRRWLDEIGVAATPGIDFDPRRGSGFVRLSYSEAPRDVSAAVDRIGRWLEDHRM